MQFSFFHPGSQKQSTHALLHVYLDLCTKQNAFLLDEIPGAPPMHKLPSREMTEQLLLYALFRLGIRCRQANEDLRKEVQDALQTMVVDQVGNTRHIYSRGSDRVNYRQGPSAKEVENHPSRDPSCRMDGPIYAPSVNRLGFPPLVI